MLFVQSRTFSALAIPNYRRYYGGQAISLVGTWMQTIAQGWLLLTLTGSGTALGLLVAVQMTPILLLGPYGGVIADRVDKRRLMSVLLVCMESIALTLAILSATGPGQVCHVLVLAGMTGCCPCLSHPTRPASTPT